MLSVNADVDSGRISLRTRSAQQRMRVNVIITGPPVAVYFSFFFPDFLNRRLFTFIGNGVLKSRKKSLVNV